MEVRPVLFRFTEARSSNQLGDSVLPFSAASDQSIGYCEQLLNVIHQDFSDCFRFSRGGSKDELFPIRVQLRLQSDCAVVPVNRPNKGRKLPAEAGEGTAQLEENIVQLHLLLTLSRNQHVPAFDRCA